MKPKIGQKEDKALDGKSRKGEKEKMEGAENRETKKGSDQGQMLPRGSRRRQVCGHVQEGGKEGKAIGENKDGEKKKQ